VYRGWVWDYTLLPRSSDNKAERSGLKVSPERDQNFISLSRRQAIGINKCMKKRILILEDDPDILFTLNMILEGSGYEVDQLTSGKTIMDDTCRLPDLYILDKRMPDMDGLDVCKHIRNRAETKDTPVIIISASPKFGSPALKAGANDFLEKPFQLKVLLEMVSKYISTPPEKQLSKFANDNSIS
jgi:DNA-binding response OmpR family regulator